MEATITRYHEAYDPDISRLCAAFTKESLTEYGLDVGEERLTEMIKLCKAVSFYMLVDRKLVGIIGGFLVNNLTNGKPALQEVVWYVDKAHRSHGRKLLEYFEQAAKTMGAAHIIMGLMCNSKAEKLGKFYERMGYKPFEIQYMKEIK